MRRISEFIYTVAFFACGLWALSSGLTTLFGGLEDVSMTGTWSSALMVVISVVIRIFGTVQKKHTKTLSFLGFTALFGGVWGIGTVLVILAGTLMITRGFKQVTVLKEQPSMRELRQIRKEKLAEIEDEERVVTETNTTLDTKGSVSEELLQGFIGSDNHKREIQTWIDEQEFDKLDLTLEEVRAKAKQEIRKNKLSLETLLALEELEGTEQEEEVDLTYANLDLPTSEDETEEEEPKYDLEVEPLEVEHLNDGLVEEPEEFGGVTLEELLGD